MWWREQIETSPNDFQLIVALLVFTRWAGPTTFIGLWKLFDTLVKNLSPVAWNQLAEGIRTLAIESSDSSRFAWRSKELPSQMSVRSAVCLSWQVKDEPRKSLFDKCFRNDEGDDRVVLEHCQMEAVRIAHENPKAWHSLLPLIRRCYSLGVIADRFWGAAMRHTFLANSLPESIAQTIVRAPDEYPSNIVAVADGVMRQNAINSVVAVGDVAIRDKWFT